MTTGNYQALTHPLEFRLLQLQPGEYKAPLVAELIVCRLDDLSRPWTALSYTWGDPQWRGNIACNGVQVSITGNLHSALSGMRRSDKPILVWADAICINQGDRKEKEAQVLLMRRIYSSASLVLADLGGAGPDYQDVVDIWNALYNLIESNTPEEYVDCEQYDSYGLPAIEDPKWKKWHRFLARPWFRRVWVQQEFALASSVAMMYGTDKIPGEMLPRIVSESMQRGFSSTILDGDDDKTQRRDADNGSYALTSMLTARQDHQNGQTRGLFHHLRYLSAYCQATDDRDRIYALLGLATDAERATINVDYSETVAEVYHRAASCLISRGDGLNLVYEAGCYDCMDQLPSWAPNWAGDRKSESIGLAENHGWANAEKQMYQAGGFTSSHITFDPDRRRLHIRGIRICAIKAVSEPFVPNLPTSLSLRKYRMFDFGRAYHNFYSKHKDSLRYEKGKGRLDAFWRTLICDTFRDETRKLMRPAPSHLSDCFLAFSEYCQSINIAGLPMKPLSTLASRFMTACEASWSGRRLCVTQDGYIGLAPWRAMEGDKISVFLGGPAPFVTRGTPTGHDMLVGECYIHGLMDGEALEMDELKEQDIVLE